MYRVDSNVASAPCGNDQPVAMPVAYVRFNKGSLYGNDFYAYDECSDPAGDECFAAGGLFEGFYEPIDGGWQGRTSYSAGNWVNCTLSTTVSTAIVRGQKLFIESTTHSFVGETAMDACTNEEAEARGDDMECTRHTKIEATKL